MVRYIPILSIPIYHLFIPPWFVSMSQGYIMNFFQCMGKYRLIIHLKLSKCKMICWGDSFLPWGIYFPEGVTPRVWGPNPCRWGKSTTTRETTIFSVYIQKFVTMYGILKNPDTRGIDSNPSLVGPMVPCGANYGTPKTHKLAEISRGIAIYSYLHTLHLTSPCLSTWSYHMFPVDPSYPYLLFMTSGHMQA